jgi:hypothetical protein
MVRTRMQAPAMKVITAIVPVLEGVERGWNIVGGWWVVVCGVVWCGVV